MGEKRKNESIYNSWYDISSEVGKQLFDISNLSKLNYGTLQESWKGYSERLGEQISKLMQLDESSYKDMLTLWQEFTDSMNSQISSLTKVTEPTYMQWYDMWLENTDKISKSITDVIQKQMEYNTELYEENDLWSNKFGITDEQKQQILDISRIMSEYWLEAVNKTTEIVKESINPESKTNFTIKFQEFYDYLSWAYTNMVKQLINTNNYEYLKTFGESNQNDMTKLYDELESLKKEVSKLSSELGAYKKQKNTRGKKK